MKLRGLFTLLIMLIPVLVLAQGVTTASFDGRITDTDGTGLLGTNIVITHIPSGTVYGSSTREDGFFNVSNVRVGGPYEVKVSYIGYVTARLENIFLKVGEDYTVNITLEQKTVEMDEVVVTANKDGVINADRTGSATFIKSEDLESMPTIARSAKDLTRLTPESDGNSFGGRNNLYNNFSLDGSIFNNSFGLDYATPGGQADAQPVSLDAIEQIQVSLAPFDIRESGFTGAGVNAVTKSGTNQIKGKVYHYQRNEAMIGKKVGDTETENLDFNTTQTGFSLGAPIIKNKLFVFVNAEAERRDELAHGFVAKKDANHTGANVTSVNEADIQAVQNRLRDYWGYEPGDYQGYNHETYNNKFLLKVDWNISDIHNFSFRYNYLDAWKDILPHPEAIIGRGPTSYRLPFENSSYTIANKIHSVVSELHSRFSSNLSNDMLIGYTIFRDERNPHSKPYPVLDIFDANGNLAITMGSEMFSTHNRLYQDVFQFTNNLSYYKDRHTFTAGINYEMFKFDNSFNLFYYPWNTFESVDHFLSTTRDDIDFDAQVAAAQQNDYAWAYVDVAQLGLYIQDDYKYKDNLKLTFGLRMDLPIYMNEIDPNDEVKDFDGWVNEDGESVKLDPSQWPSANPLWAPRFGFNWDVYGDRSMQVRGGSGIFSGRIPFVWLGNQSTNSRIDPGYEFQVNATSEGFHFPQVWKNNIAVDKSFGDGWIATFEGLISKDINAVVHRNYNMLPPSGQLTGTGDTREMFAGFNESNIYSASANSIGFLDAGVIILDNTKKGHQYNFTGKLEKNFTFGLKANVAYTYMESKDLTSIPAEIAADAFQRNPIVGNPNDPMFTHSRYGLNHRIISSLMYNKEYKNMKTSVAVFFEAGKGNRYSFTYAGDLNQDGIANNDLLYVPENASDIHFGSVTDGIATEASDAAAQWAALDAFIEQDDYLKERRGDYAERHGATLPWFSQIDVRVMQDVKLNFADRDHTIRLSFDILNFGNMISSNFGVRQLPNTYNPISVNGVDANGTPYFGFNTNLKDSYIDDVSVLSKWQMQIGLSYIF